MKHLLKGLGKDIRADYYYGMRSEGSNGILIICEKGGINFRDIKDS